MDILDIYNLDNFNKTSDIIKIIINYNDDYITIYYNDTFDQTIKMEKRGKKFYYLYNTCHISYINNMSIHELFLDKNYNINSNNIKEAISLAKNIDTDVISHLCILFDYSNEEIPKYQESISYIKLFNILHCNQLNITAVNIFKTGQNRIEIPIFNRYSTKIYSHLDAIAISIIFSKICYENEKVYMAKIINNLTYDDYIKTINLTPTINKNITIYFYQFKINSFIVLILKSIKTLTREYIFTKIMKNKIYYDIENFKVNVSNFYDENSHKSPGYIINKYYEEYPHSLCVNIQ